MMYSIVIRHTIWAIGGHILYYILYKLVCEFIGIVEYRIVDLMIHTMSICGAEVLLLVAIKCVKNVLDGE